jgi:predicted aspartyl protease
MRSVLIAAAILLLPGCANPTPGPLAAIPYRNDDRLIMVEASINGAAPAWFMLDSGAAHSVIDPRLQHELGLPVLTSGTTTGTGAGSVALQHAAAARMKIGTVEIALPDPWVIDLSRVPISADARGLVGAELFKAYVVRIDPRRRTLEIFDRAGFRPERGAASIPLVLDGDKMFVDLRLDVRPGLSVTERLRVDTGAQESVNDPIVEQALERRRTEQGHGLGADFIAWSGRLQAVHIGPWVIRDVWGPGSPGPAIGMELLRRFIVTFDAPHGRLYLMPTAALHEPVPPPS